MGCKTPWNKKQVHKKTFVQTRLYPQVRYAIYYRQLLPVASNINNTPGQRRETDELVVNKEISQFM